MHKLYILYTAAICIDIVNRIRYSTFVNNFSQRSISTSSSFHRFENGYEENDQNRASLENRSQSSMSLDSLIRPGQMVAANEYTNNVDVETPMDVTETEIGENKERRNK